MISRSKKMEAILQDWRFKKVKPYLNGSVLDFGGNKGELKKFVRGKYTLVNLDHSKMKGKKFNIIVLLAVIEHIGFKDVFKLFKKFKKHLLPGGKIFLTTPTKIGKPILDIMAFFNILDKKNMEEHKHYWSKKEIFDLAKKNGFVIEKFSRFQLGMNQLSIFKI
jgi:2-polyprenyl-3-methyl-5-hydroxy-6-metoxy-1,4-benzoquinol methylase